MFSKTNRGYIKKFVAIFLVPLLWFIYRKSILDIEFQKHEVTETLLTLFNFTAVNLNDELLNFFQNICYFKRLVFMVFMGK